MQSPELSGDRNSTRGSGTNLPLPQRPRSRMDGPSCTTHGSSVRPSALHPPRVGIGGRGMVRVLDSVGDGAHDDGNKHGDRQVFHWPFSDVASCVTDRGFTCSTVKTRTGGAVCGRNRSAIRDDLEIKPVSIWMQPALRTRPKNFHPDTARVVADQVLCRTASQRLGGKLDRHAGLLESLINAVQCRLIGDRKSHMV